MKRRAFLKSSFSFSLLSVTGCGGGERKEEERYIKLCEAFIPISEAGLSERDIKEIYSKVRKSLDESNRSIFGWVLWAIDWLPLFYGKLRTFRKLSVETRRELLKRMEKGGLITGGLFLSAKQFVLLGLIMDEKFTKKLGWEDMCR